MAVLIAATTVDAVDVELASAKPAHTVRHVPMAALRPRLVTDRVPLAGDVVLARVTEVGQHKRIELVGGRKADLFAGDTVLVAYGARYAPDQYEAAIPDGLGPCQLVAAGGIAAVVQSSHAMMTTATQLEPLGLLVDVDDRTVNLRDHAPIVPRNVRQPCGPPWTVLVAGTAMNAGKTTVAAHIVKGLSRMGYRVGAAKVTGTGSGGDTWLMRDAGAVRVVDFTDGGYASTFQVPANEVTALAGALLDELAAEPVDPVDAVVVELADGLLQTETAGLLATPEFTGRVDAAVFAAGDALGGVMGVQRLIDLGLPVRMASGRFTAAPLAVREARAALGVPVVLSKDFAEPEVVGRLIAPAT
ncbi:molybdopterin-guanine dinucleotide biosynthesis protein MobB [Kibdelosporangium aridum]|nr:molybdopterin-guanine dinucleotide biosynthesis protein MobB [Kibdelosporangium aridum]